MTATVNERYGLTERPFQLTPDPRYWFESATHRKAMAYLGYGLAQGEGFIVITGEIGAGKTTLVGHLMQTIDPLLVNAVKIVSTFVEHDDLLRMVAQALELPSEGEKAQLLGRIESFVIARGKAGQKTLLILDEAQNLPLSSLEELRMLSNFQLGGQSLLQILLLGQPEFRESLKVEDELEQLRQRIIASHHLTVMLPEEIGPYVEHRMKLAGWMGKPGFSAETFAALHRHSGGLPRKINMLMTRVLLLASLDGANHIDGAMIENVVADLAKDQAVTQKPEPPALKLVPPVARPAEAVPSDLADRIAALEAQVEEQGSALRRVLALLLQWVEADEGKDADGRRAQG